MRSLSSFCLVLLAWNCMTVQLQAQNLLESSKDGTLLPYYSNGVIGIALRRDLTIRHDLFGYNSIKFNQEQVVSMHQEHGNQDLIYYINSDGVTQYISYGSTSHTNLNHLFTPRRDSFNPYGVKNPLEGVVTGVLKMVFTGRFDWLNNRKK